jgi:hypothetical protein
MLALLLMVEVSYVVVSEYFEHASVYKARLIARTKILAAGEGDRLRRSTGEMFPPDSVGDKTVFRVVPRFESKDGGADRARQNHGRPGRQSMPAEHDEDVFAGAGSEADGVSRRPRFDSKD